MSFRTTVRIVGGRVVDSGVCKKGEIVFEFISDLYPLECEVIENFRGSDWAMDGSRPSSRNYDFTWETVSLNQARPFTLRKVERATHYWIAPSESHE